MNDIDAVDIIQKKGVKIQSNTDKENKNTSFNNLQKSAIT